MNCVARLGRTMVVVVLVLIDQQSLTDFEAVHCLTACRDLGRDLTAPVITIFGSDIPSV
jgi:hypothetical protein